MEVDEETDKQYSCSKWCIDMSPSSAIDNHIRILSERSSSSRNTLKHEYYRYPDAAPTEETKYAMFPSSATSDKLVVYIHGGYWQALDLNCSNFLADFFVSRNCNFAAIGYDLCPNVSLEKIVFQVRMALKSLMARFPEMREIFLCGHSAGAHLSLISIIFDEYDDDLLLSDSEKDRLAGLILISGIYDLRPLCCTSINANLSLTADTAWRLSPMRILNGDCTSLSRLRLLILVAEHDSPAFIKQSIQLSDLLKNVVNCHYSLVKQKDHFSICHDIGDSGYEVTYLLARFACLEGFLQMSVFPKY